MALTAAHKKALTNAGIDWKNLNWAQIIQLVMALIAAFGDKNPPVMKAGETCDPDCCECCRQHFELIKAVAECGAKCCGG